MATTLQAHRQAADLQAAVPARHSDKTPAEASSAQPELRPEETAAASLAAEKIAYLCSNCQRFLTLEENTSVICSCGWRIVQKRQKKLLRTFSTD